MRQLVSLGSARSMFWPGGDAYQVVTDCDHYWIPCKDVARTDGEDVVRVTFGCRNCPAIETTEAPAPDRK